MSAAQPGPRPSTRDSTYIDPYEPEYPSSDGKPMAESTTQFRWIVTIKEGLDALFADRDDVFVAGDLLWYATKNDVHDVMAPDAMVVFGRPRGDRRSYREWVEEGVVPQVVFEVASHTNTPEEMARKRRRYDARGVEEYYFYDPESEAGDFEAWIRRPDGLQAIKGDGWTSPLLEVTFHAPRRKEALEIVRPDGRPFRSFGELAKDEEAARRIAKTARRIAKTERRRRRQAEHQVDAERRLRADAEHQVDAERRLRADAEHQVDAERRLRADAEHQVDALSERVDAERRLREESDARARADRERAERLAALLRERGIDPE